MLYKCERKNWNKMFRVAKQQVLNARRRVELCKYRPAFFPVSLQSWTIHCNRDSVFSFWLSFSFFPTVCFASSDRFSHTDLKSKKTKVINKANLNAKKKTKIQIETFGNNCFLIKLHWKQFLFYKHINFLKRQTMFSIISPKCWK